MNLSLGLTATAKHFPSLSAVEWEKGSLTYSQLENQVNELAHSLQNYQGLSKGAKVALAMENCPEFIVVLFAIWRAGMTAIPLNAKLHPKEFTWIFKNSQVDLIFASQEIAQKLDYDKIIICVGSKDYTNHFTGKKTVYCTYRST
jgi:long-chain acyl-CoA synthetase